MVRRVDEREGSENDELLKGSCMTRKGVVPGVDISHKAHRS